LSGFLQYKEKIETAQKSLKKEEELTNVYKQLQVKSNQIIDSTNEILSLNKELRVANDRIVELQKEQNEDLKNRSRLDCNIAIHTNNLKKCVNSYLLIQC